jgi:hypothetical protein
MLRGHEKDTFGKVTVATCNYSLYQLSGDQLFTIPPFFDVNKGTTFLYFTA